MVPTLKELTVYWVTFLILPLDCELLEGRHLYSPEKVYTIRDLAWIPTLALLLLLESFQLCDLFRGMECRRSEWEKEETGWHSSLPLAVDAEWICCCLAHPLVPWGWEEWKLRSLWRLGLVGSRSFLCLVNAYSLGCKLTARTRLGLWALSSGLWIPGMRLSKVRTKVKRKWWNSLSGQNAIISPRTAKFLGTRRWFDCAYVIGCICKWQSFSQVSQRGGVGCL